ncbi:type II toxin-antitoxin system RelE/ParE family toxin [Candidatus Wolfebacteria bacterium]|nr:type II toxin-antitoxin system RelE/ParE family toxin [Candidatus Wolfebacteria bacterium]
MDKIKKALRRLTPKERERVKEILKQLNSRHTENLDIKKLKGRDDIFRARKGNIRIIYRVDEGKIFILAVERRSEKTYK